MADLLHEISIQAEPQVVYEAWTTAQGLASWWTKDARIADAMGGVNVFVFNAGNIEFHFRVDEQIPGERVRWTGIAADKMPEEWVDTRIEVDITGSEETTRLQFGHKNWKSTEGMYGLCNTTWGELMYRLRDYCEGKGRGPLFSG